MPATLTYPGVYIEEIPSGVRTITGVATSITAFIGRALRGPVDDPTRVQSFAEYERIFGGLDQDSTMSYAVYQFFLNGGADALIVRIVPNDAAAAAGTVGGLDIDAANEGGWTNRLRVTVDHNTADPADTLLFNLTVAELTGTNLTDDVVASESFLNISVDTASPRYVESVLENRSQWIRAGSTIPGSRPSEDEVMLAGGDNGGDLAVGDYEGSAADRTGIFALDKADLFNILCIPPRTRAVDTATSTWSAALTYCKNRRAMLIIDPPNTWAAPADVESDSNSSSGVFTVRDENSVLYYPRVKLADLLQENRAAEFVPCGVVAGIWASTDTQRGVWKAPAGQDAGLRGVIELAYKMTDGQNGLLNPIGVNCLRTFPITGNVVWGARTLEGADRLASEWKYVPVRRTALFIEESLYRGTQWAVFEPNDEPLWAQLRLNIGAFMQNLFRQGAFQGSSAREAYFVKVDSETTTQNDINLGIVNIIVGFAPLKPAEFVVIKIQQIAGQVEV